MLTFLLVLPSISCHQFSAGQALGVVVPDELELLDESSFFEQEMTMRPKSNTEKIMSICLTWFPFGGLGEPNIYHDSVVFYKYWGFYLEGV